MMRLPKKNQQEEKDWYEKSYGDHASKLLNEEKKDDEEEDEFEDMFKMEEAKLRQENNAEIQDNSVYDSQSESINISGLTIK